MTPPSLARSQRPGAAPPGEIPRRTIRFVLAGAPLACIVAFLGNLFIVREGCEAEALIGRFALVIAAGIVSAWAGTVAWRSWRSVRDVVPQTAGGHPGRNRFFAAVGIASGALGVLLAIGWLGVLLTLDHCLRG